VIPGIFQAEHATAFITGSVLGEASSARKKHERSCSGKE
jgi:hypothetical protein